MQKNRRAHFISVHSIDLLLKKYDDDDDVTSGCVHLCLTVPCRNNGRTTDCYPGTCSSDGSTCSCAPGFRGDNCQTCKT